MAARLRGMLGSVNQLAVTVGLLLAYVMGVLCKWRWLAFIGGVSPALLVILMFTMPETPRWSLGKNRRSEALRALRWLRGPDADIEEECFAIEATLGKANFPSLFTNPLLIKGKVFSKTGEFTVLVLSMVSYKQSRLTIMMVNTGVTASVL